MVWAQNIIGLLNPRLKYYQHFGEKLQASLYAQEQHRLSERFSTQVTAQLRYQRYQFDQVRMGAFKGYDYTVDWLFFSPRIGVTCNASERVSLFGNVAVSSRTPTDASIYDANDPDATPLLELEYLDTDSTAYRFGDPTVKNERVYDFECGARYRSRNATAEITLFWMDFHDEMIPDGGINDDGVAITVNADRSVHAGVEFAASVKPTGNLTVSGNLAYNHNRVKEYTALVESEDVDSAGKPVWYPVDFKNKTISGAPDVLANMIVDFDHDRLRTTARLRVVGKRFMELHNVEALAIASYATLSWSAAYTCGRLFGVGDATFSVRIDNVLDKKYLAAGYGGNYAYEDDAEIKVGGWAEYFVAPERTVYTQLAIELF